jgi:hypothetical protein
VNKTDKQTARLHIISCNGIRILLAGGVTTNIFMYLLKKVGKLNAEYADRNRLSLCQTPSFIPK